MWYGALFGQFVLLFSPLLSGWNQSVLLTHVKPAGAFKYASLASHNTNSYRFSLHAVSPWPWASTRFQKMKLRCKIRIIVQLRKNNDNKRGTRSSSTYLPPCAPLTAQWVRSWLAEPYLDGARALAGGTRRRPSVITKRVMEAKRRRGAKNC